MREQERPSKYTGIFPKRLFSFEGCSSGKHKRKQVELYEALKFNLQALKWIMIPILLRYHYFYRSPTCSTRMKSSDLTLVKCICFTALLYTKVNLISLCTWVNTKSSPLVLIKDIQRTLSVVVSFAAVIRVVTQCSSPTGRSVTWRP